MTFVPAFPTSGTHDDEIMRDGEIVQSLYYLPKVPTYQGKVGMVMSDTLPTPLLIVVDAINHQLRYQLLPNNHVAPPLFIENNAVALAENQAMEDALPLDDEYGNGKF